MKEFCPLLLPLYDSFPEEIFRVDFVRAVYLYRWGGIYADLDYQCLQPVNHLWGTGKTPEVLLGMMGTNPSFPHSIPNALMGSIAGSLFWIGYLSNIERAWEALRNEPNVSKRPEYVTGPVVLKTTVKRLLSDSARFISDAAQFGERYNIDIAPSSLQKPPTIEIKPGFLVYPIDWSDSIHREFKENLLKNQTLLSLEQARQRFPHSFGVTYWAHSW